MKTAQWIGLTCMWFLGACASDATPDFSGLLTRAEASDFRETSSYDDVMAFSTALAEGDSRIHLTSFGTTGEGREMPLLVVGDVADASPEAVAASGKVRVFIQGNIHGGEVPGKEAVLMLLRDWAEGEYPDWTRDLVLLVAPIYNADGNERVELTNRPRQHGPVGGMGQRPNAQGLDLNRDHMKLASPEARALVGMMNAYDPHVAVDLHTTDGSRHGYHLTYSPPLHPDADAGIMRLLREDWLPAVTESVKDKRGWDFYYYGNASDRRGTRPMGWYTFDHRPRFNNNYVGLRNRIAILSEAYAYATFEDRVLATLYFVEEILNFAQDHTTEIREVTAAADEATVPGMVLSTRSGFAQNPATVDILMGEVDEEAHPETGEVMLRRRDVQVPTPMLEFGTFEATETEVAPSAYLIPGDMVEVIGLLENHGVVMTRLEEARPARVQRFMIDSTSASPRVFQDRNERQVWGTYQEADVELTAGTAVVSLTQPLGRLAFHLLEPRADDGFLNWAILDLFIREGEAYPIMRVMSPLDSQ